MSISGNNIIYDFVIDLNIISENILQVIICISSGNWFTILCEKLFLLQPNVKMYLSVHTKVVYNVKG
jgi:hypothetical protein